MIKALVILLLNLCLSTYSIASTQCWLEDKVTGKKFRIFNALLYKNLPDMYDLCIEDINILYASEFFPRGPIKNSPIMPKINILNKAIEKAKKRNLLTVIDIEHWSIRNKEVADISIQNYLSIINAFKTQLPNLKIGYYGIVPTVDFSRAKSHSNSTGYLNWVAENNLVKPIANMVDATFPSLYTINSNKNSWLIRAKAHIKESHRLAINKPVYPFIWPNYHPQGGKYPKGFEIESNYWMLQLGFLRGNADGIVLWGGYKQKFDNQMQWWLDIKNFINEHYFLRKVNNIEVLK